MAIITPPAPLPLRGVKWRAPFPAQINRSGWTGRRKVVGMPGTTVWTASATFATIVTEASARQWRGFFLSLQGSVNSFPLIAVEAAQTASANPTSAAGGTGGATQPVTGLPVSGTVLTAGCLMTFTLPSGHKRLVCLTADLVSNGSGNATASFYPELGEVPAAGAAIEMQQPFGLMALTSDPPGWDVDLGQTYTFPLTCEEAL